MPGSCLLTSFALLTRDLALLLILSLALVRCGSGTSPSALDGQSGHRIAGPADSGAPDAGCGLGFDDAVEAFAPERVCQTTEYDLTAGYCTHWVACSAL